MLLALLPLEAGGWQLRVVAESYEDEQRLLGWLRRAGLIDDLAAALDRLDQADEGTR
jgi:hypothetical protein